MMAEKVRISRIEINGQNCRVFLSDGKELDGLMRILPGEASHGELMTVQLDAIIGAPDNGVC